MNGICACQGQSYLMPMGVHGTPLPKKIFIRLKDWVYFYNFAPYLKNKFQLNLHPQTSNKQSPITCPLVTYPYPHQTCLIISHLPTPSPLNFSHVICCKGQSNFYSLTHSLLSLSLSNPQLEESYVTCV